MRYQLTALVTGLLLSNVVSAATAVDLHHQPAAYLQRHLALQQVRSASNSTQIQTTSTDVDFNQTAHTRIQQTYAGIPVWDATGVVHTPKASANARKNGLREINANTRMNGVIYEGLEKDLANTPAYALTDTQKGKALQLAKADFSKKMKSPIISAKEESVKTIVFIDENKQAHYAYLASFYVDNGRGAHIPTAIIDAATLKIYRTWDQVLTANLADNSQVKAALQQVRSSKRDVGEIYDLTAGGVGGNEKVGEYVYDGLESNPAPLGMKATDMSVEVLPGSFQTITFCMLAADDIEVVDVSFDNNLVYGLCIKDPNEHNGLNWLSLDKGYTRWLDDEMNGGYSPAIDAFANATVIKKFYNDWYNIPALVNEDGTPMKMIMRVHYGRSYDNAFWDGKVMTFGDGGKMFYPLTSLGVSAHEISHGFTSQHSRIDYFFPQMGALHESFSDMAAVAVNYFHTKTLSWELGREIMKGEGALRYLDNPKKDGRSIDNMKDFDETEAHAGAGVFNKAFYLIGTSKGWDVQKAFNVMVKANMHYWTSSMMTLNEAACGVVAATKDYGYNIADVRVAFSKVGIDTDGCEVH